MWKKPAGQAQQVMHTSAGRLKINVTVGHGTILLVTAATEGGAGQSAQHKPDAAAEFIGLLWSKSCMQAASKPFRAKWGLLCKCRASLCMISDIDVCSSLQLGPHLSMRCYCYSSNAAYKASIDG